MKVIQIPHELREALNRHWSNAKVGLVPTMGNLHEGHFELVRRAKMDCDVVVTTLFVNPLQFGTNEDLDGYPQSFDADRTALETLEIEILFCPTTETMYPLGQTSQTKTSVPGIGNTLCGERRHGHFDGVTTVVTKLFNLVQPDRAYFGEKDWQQLVIIRKLVHDLNFPIDTIGVPTVRANDNLALSSRNHYLTAHERRVAPRLYQQLCSVRDLIQEGNTDYSSAEESAKAVLSAVGFRPEYVVVRDADTLDHPNDNSNELRVFGAAHLGRARLIDNVPIGCA